MENDAGEKQWQKLHYLRNPWGPCCRPYDKIETAKPPDYNVFPAEYQPSDEISKNLNAQGIVAEGTTMRVEPMPSESEPSLREAE